MQALPSVAPTSNTVRSDSDRRVFERRGKSAEELAAAVLCASAGVRFCGVQKGDASIGLASLILFDNRFKSTLAVKFCTASVEEIKRIAAESEAKWLPAVAA